MKELEQGHGLVGRHCAPVVRNPPWLRLLFIFRLDVRQRDFGHAVPCGDSGAAQRQHHSSSSSSSSGGTGRNATASRRPAFLRCCPPAPSPTYPGPHTPCPSGEYRNPVQNTVQNTQEITQPRGRPLFEYSRTMHGLCEPHSHGVLSNTWRERPEGSPGQLSTTRRLDENRMRPEGTHTRSKV